MLPFEWFILSCLILACTGLPQNSREQLGVISSLEVGNTFWTKLMIASGEELRKIIDIFYFNFIILFFHLQKLRFSICKSVNVARFVPPKVECKWSQLQNKLDKYNL